MDIVLLSELHSEIMSEKRISLLYQMREKGNSHIHYKKKKKDGQVNEGSQFTFYN